MWQGISKYARCISKGESNKYLLKRLGGHQRSGLQARNSFLMVQLWKQRERLLRGITALFY